MSASYENLSEATMLKAPLTTILVLFLYSSLFTTNLSLFLYQEKTEGLAGNFKKSPKAAPRSVVTEVITLRNLMLHVLMCGVRVRDQRSSIFMHYSLVFQDPLSQTMEVNSSFDSLTETAKVMNFRLCIKKKIALDSRDLNV